MAPVFDGLQFIWPSFDEEAAEFFDALLICSAEGPAAAGAVGIEGEGVGAFHLNFVGPLLDAVAG